MNELSNDERNLLRHYAEGDRLISRSQRAPVHQHLLRIGFIEESQSAEDAPFLRAAFSARRRPRSAFNSSSDMVLPW
jgi:hypothetical protein